MENDEIDSKTEKKRMIMLIAGVFAVLAVVLSLAFAFIPDGSDQEEDIKSEVFVSKEDQLIIEELSSSIMEDVGNFGVVTDSLTAENALDVEYIIAQTPNSGGEFYISRKNSYDKIREDILKESPIDYSPKVASEWINESETDGLISYEMISQNSTAVEKGSYLNFNGTDEAAAYVDVNFTSKETIRQATADDSSWDGSYDILEKTFPNNTLRMTFIKDSNNEWKLYSIINLENKFLLSTWETPSSFDTYATTQYDFKKVGKLNREKPLSPPED